MPGGKRRKKAVTRVTVSTLKQAVDCLTVVQRCLRECEANNAALAVARAKKSVGGALRHAQLILDTEPTGKPT